jgi:acetyl esterase/lipase
MAIAQVQVMTGASVPFAAGCPRRRTKSGDTRPEATLGDLAAANLILATLRAARAPLVISICGGGFITGSKEKMRIATVRNLLEAGISVAAVNYRLLSASTSTLIWR